MEQMNINLMLGLAFDKGSEKDKEKAIEYYKKRG